MNKPLISSTSDPKSDYKADRVIAGYIFNTQASVLGFVLECWRRAGTEEGGVSTETAGGVFVLKAGARPCGSGEAC